MYRQRGSGVAWIKQRIDTGCLTEGEDRIVNTLKDVEANIEWGQNVYAEVVHFRWYRELHTMRSACLRSLKAERR